MIMKLISSDIKIGPDSLVILASNSKGDDSLLYLKHHKGYSTTEHGMFICHSGSISKHLNATSVTVV